MNIHCVVIFPILLLVASLVTAQHRWSDIFGFHRHVTYNPPLIEVRPPRIIRILRSFEPFDSPPQPVIYLPRIHFVPETYVEERYPHAYASHIRFEEPEAPPYSRIVTRISYTFRTKILPVLDEDKATVADSLPSDSNTVLQVVKESKAANKVNDSAVDSKSTDTAIASANGSKGTNKVSDSGNGSKATNNGSKSGDESKTTNKATDSGNESKATNTAIASGNESKATNKETVIKDANAGKNTEVSVEGVTPKPNKETETVTKPEAEKTVEPKTNSEVTKVSENSVADAKTEQPVKDEKNETKVENPKPESESTKADDAKKGDTTTAADVPTA